MLLSLSIYIYITIFAWWFQTWLDDFPCHIWDVILPIDELICFKMVKTTNQYYYNQLLTSPPHPTPPHAPHVSVASTSCALSREHGRGNVNIPTPLHSTPPILPHANCGANGGRCVASIITEWDHMIMKLL